MAHDLGKAQERLDQYVDTIGAEPPRPILSEDGGPSPELLKFCRDYGASLDWIFRGDTRAMMQASRRVAGVVRDINDINDAHAVIHDAGGLVVALQVMLWGLNGTEIPADRADLHKTRHALVAVGDALEGVFKNIAA